MNSKNWDDIRYALAVDRYGSLNAAAAALGVTHATVLRRVAAFEKRFGCTVFRKNLSGYSALPEARSVFSAMENVESAIRSLERTVAGADQSPAGQVRIASTDSLSQIVLPEILTQISNRYPKLQLVLLSGNSHHDLSRLTADIAVRPSTKLGDGLLGTRAGELAFGIYGDGRPGRRWMKLEGALSSSLPAAWMADHVDPRDMTNGADSFLVLRQMAVAGVGKAFLPKIVGESGTGLQRLTVEDPGLVVPLWVATLEEIAQTPRFALVQRILVEQISLALAKLMGPAE